MFVFKQSSYPIPKKTAIMCSFLLLSDLAFAGINTTTQIPVPGSHLKILKQAHLLGALAADTKMHVSVWLKLRNEESFKKAIEAMYDPNSPQYQQFINKEQFNADFAPSQEAFNIVQQYFIDQGLQVAKKNRLRIEVTGTAAQIEHAFNVEMNQYTFEGKTVYSNTTPPTVNTSLSPYVSEITGLSTIPRFKPHYLMAQPRSSNQATPPAKVQEPDIHSIQSDSLQSDALAPQSTPTTQSFSGFTWQELQTAYFNQGGIPPVNGTPINGKGQTIVLFDGCTSDTPQQIMDDANEFSNSPSTLGQLSYRSNFVVVNSNFQPINASTPSCSSDGGWGVEISLDVQSAHTMAPGANIVLVIDNDLNEANLIDAITKSSTHSIGGFSNANVISNSWGEVESKEPATEAALQMASAHGLSVNFSTGDCGDDTNPQDTCNNAPYPSATSTPGVNYPASSSWSTAVGGTSLFVDNNWNYSFESGWGETDKFIWSTVGFVGGGGGGVSQLYSIPAWQKKILNGFEAGGYSAPIGNFRAIPDVAMLADNNTGLKIYNTSSCKGFCAVGGTSLASPLFSGVLTLVNQVRSLTPKKSLLGTAAPYLFNQYNQLLSNKAIHVINTPHPAISGTVSPQMIGVTDAPASSFAWPRSLSGSFEITDVIFSWDSSLTLEPNTQFWNDITGVGSPNVPEFVTQMASF